MPTPRTTAALRQSDPFRRETDGRADAARRSAVTTDEYRVRLDQGASSSKDAPSAPQRGRSPTDPEKWARVGHSRWQPATSPQKDEEKPATLQPGDFFHGPIDRMFSRGRELYQDRYAETSAAAAVEMAREAHEFAKWDDKTGAHMLHRAPRGFAEMAWCREEAQTRLRDMRTQVQFEGDDRELYEKGVFHRMAYEEAELIRNKVNSSLRGEDRADVWRSGSELIAHCDNRMRLVGGAVEECVQKLHERGYHEFQPQ